MNTHLSIRTLSAAALLFTYSSVSAGVYSGGTDVRANLTVGAAANCTASVVEYPLKSSDRGNHTVAKVAVSCPNAGWVYLGIVGGDGNISYKTDKGGGTAHSRSDLAVEAPYWMRAIASAGPSKGYGNGLEITGQTTNDTFPTYDKDNGLPENVWALAMIPGSTGTFNILFKYSLSLDLNTGIYPYTMKAYGYWQ